MIKEGIIGIVIVLLMYIPSAFSQEQSGEQQYNINSLGMSFKHPYYWDITYDSNKGNNCKSTCLIALKNMDNSNATLSFYAKNCNCKDLLTNVKHQYTTTLEPMHISLISDNKTQLKDGTNAWQMEYSSGDRIRYVLWFIHDGIFYELNYQNNRHSFSKDMATTKNIINSIAFFPKDSEIEIKDNPIKQTNIVQPSFMNPKVNESSPISSNTYSNLTTEVMRNITIGEKDLPSQIFSSIIEYYPAVTLEFISNSTVVLKGDQEFMLKTENDLRSFWKAIDTVKQFGFSVDEITESGLGSVDNPTKFYTVMSLNTNFEEKLN